MIKIYGWTGLNACAYNIIVKEVDRAEIRLVNTNNYNFEVEIINYYGEGSRWFTNFSLAKKVAIRYLQDGIDWRRKAIKHLRGSKLNKIKKRRQL